MENSKVLIVDDDINVLTTLTKAIEAGGLKYQTANSGLDALKILETESFDCIMIDINMQGMNGFETIQEIKKRKNETPIVIVSGRKEDSDTIYCLDIGADDYITKPFNPVTLAAKIKAIIRRNKKADDNKIISIGPFTYNSSTLRFYKNDIEISLSSKENALIKLFLDEPNRVFTRDMLYEMIWDNVIIDEQTVIVYINRLRQKIEDNPNKPKYIQTVRGIGYRFTI